MMSRRQLKCMQTGSYVRNKSQRQGHGAGEVALRFFVLVFFPDLISVLVTSVYKYL